MLVVILFLDLVTPMMAESMKSTRNSVTDCSLLATLPRPTASMKGLASWKTTSTPVSTACLSSPDSWESEPSLLSINSPGDMASHTSLLPHELTV